jgi:hypothetical protein
MQAYVLGQRVEYLVARRRQWSERELDALSLGELAQHVSPHRWIIEQAVHVGAYNAPFRERAFADPVVNLVTSAGQTPGRLHGRERGRHR